MGLHVPTLRDADRGTDLRGSLVFRRCPVRSVRFRGRPDSPETAPGASSGPLAPFRPVQGLAYAGLPRACHPLPGPLALAEHRPHQVAEGLAVTAPGYNARLTCPQERYHILC